MVPFAALAILVALATPAVASSDGGLGAAYSAAAPSLHDTLAFIRLVGAGEDELQRWVARSPDPETAARQRAFLAFLRTLDPLPEVGYRRLASGGRLLPEMYDPVDNRVVVDEEMAAVPVEERAAFVVHCLRHYYAITRQAPGVENREIYALEAQAVFWAAARRMAPARSAGRESILRGQLDAMLEAYLSGGLEEFLEGIRGRGRR